MPLKQIYEAEVFKQTDDTYSYRCSCGVRGGSYPVATGSQYGTAEHAMDQHVEKVHVQHPMNKEPKSDSYRFYRGEDVHCTHTMVQGKVIDPHPEAGRILISFEGQTPVLHPTDTLEPGVPPHAHAHEESSSVPNNSQDAQCADDVRDDVPCDDKIPEHAPSMFRNQIAIDTKLLFTQDERWKLFTTIELEDLVGMLINRSLTGSEEALRDEMQREIHRRKKD